MVSSSPVRATVGAALALGGVTALVLASQPAAAIGTAVPLGTAESYSVLGGQTVTNTGPSVLDGDVGVSPGTAITGFPPGITLGTQHAADAHALQAQSDLTIAYDNAAGQASDDLIEEGDLGGLTLTPGVYTASSSLGLTGTVTLDGGGDPNAVFVFQVGSALTTASSSSVVLLNGVQACNVFWQVGSSATLGTGSTFVGTIMALTSISATTGATVDGRALARNGSVTLDTNTFTSSDCEVVPTPTPTPTVTPSPSVSPTPTDGPTGTPTATPSATPPGGDGTPPGGGDGTPPGGGDGNPPGGGDGNPSGGGDGSGNGSGNGTGTGDDSFGTLASTGPSVSTPLLALALGAVLVGLGLVVTSVRMRRVGS